MSEKKYRPLNSIQLVEVGLGLTGAVLASAMEAFPAHLRHKRTYREMVEINKRILKVFDHLESHDRMGEMSDIAGELATRWNDLLEELGLVLPEEEDKDAGT